MVSLLLVPYALSVVAALYLMGWLDGKENIDFDADRDAWSVRVFLVVIAPVFLFLAGVCWVGKTAYSLGYRTGRQL